MKRKPVIEDNQFGDVYGRWAVEPRFREFDPDVISLNPPVRLEEGHYFRKWAVAPFFVPGKDDEEL